MEKQLTKNGLSEAEVVAAKPQPVLPDAGPITDEELLAILSEAEKSLLERPVSRQVEVVARIASRLLVDALALFGAMWIAYWLRFENAYIVRIFPPESAATFNGIALAILGTSPVLFFALKICGMYDTRTRLRILDRIPKIVGAVNVYLVFLLIVSFLLDTSVATRGFLVFFWAFSIVFLFAGRFILQVSLSIAGISDVVMRNTLIVGSGKVGKEVARKLQRHDTFGLRPVGFIDDDPLYTDFDEPELRNLCVLGGLNDLSRIIGDFDVEKVVIAFTGATSEQLLDLASKCNKMGVECSIIPRLFEVITDEIMVNEIGGIPLIRLREKKINGYRRLLKSAEDYVLGSIALLLTWPIILFTAIAIKVDSPGPVFFRHKRVGKNGKCFNCLKFRSMVDGAYGMQGDMVNGDADAAHGWLCWKNQEDPRVTRVGKWIRKFSIDELPQLFNVLSGKMSMVGPRPHIKEEVQQYKGWHKQRLNVKPGITGLWQVSGRSDLPFDEMIKLDLYYIETWSVWTDFKIIMRTFSAIVSSNGAY
ncbi:MAG: sugar transferase [Actinobacteria bacterium]|jgi:exopolysaccharide biosynthesis polyprenyl glycosylphosphotransferase|nr:MAG: sugar transferase [Actinomycetota bacterium]